MCIRDRANPRTAPYGAAAMQALRGLGLWASVEPRAVYGENVAQAFGFVATGNAELGFVVLAQISSPGGQPEGSAWIVPRRLHAPIEQQAVLLAAGLDNPAAVEFVKFLRSPAARSIIERAGYDVEAPWPP